MIELTVICPECGKRGDHGKVEINLHEGTMKVTCGWCRVAFICGIPVLSSPIRENSETRLPHWKRELLGQTSVG